MDNKNNPGSEEFIFSPEPEDKKSGVNTKSSDDEFIIPESLDLTPDFGKMEGSGSQTSPATDYAESFWRPYVPRFTEVTENRYYFAGAAQPSQGEKSEPKKTSSDTNEPIVHKQSGPSISVQRIEGRVVASSDKKDPTAEIKSTVPDAVVVNIKGKPAVSDSTINVFKFPDGKAEPKPAEPSDEEKERKEISTLTGHVFDDAESEAPKEDLSTEAPDVKAEPDDASVSAPKPDTISQKEREFKVKKDEYDYAPSGEEKPSEKNSTDTSDYNSFAMKDGFKDIFLDSIMAVKIRIIVGIIFSLGILAMELFSAKISSILGFTGALNAPMLIESALIVSLMIITLPEIIVGIRGLMNKKLTSELALFAPGAVILAATIYFGVATGDTFFLGSTYAVIALTTMFANYYWQKANFTAFKTVSVKGTKHIVDCKVTRTLEAHNMALDGIVDEHKSKCAKVFETIFVSGFFDHASRRREDGKNCIIWLSIALGVSLSLGAVVLVLFNLSYAIAAAATVFALTSPAAAVLSRKLAYSVATDKLSRDEGCVIGEASMYEIAKADVLIFDDTEVFGPEDVTLKSASDKYSNYYDSMRKMASLYRAVGGPLLSVFESALNNNQFPAATDASVEDDGVSGYVDGNLIEAGTKEYMQRKNIAVPYKSELHVGGTRVIYAAENGEFFGAFTVNYSFSEEFAMMLSVMNESGIVPLVYTRDFNITNELMKGLTRGNDIIRVMRKYDTPKPEKPFARIRCAAVCSEKKESALDTIVSAKKYTSLVSLLSTVELCASVAGAIAAAVIAIVGQTFAVPGIVFAIWQAALGVAHSVITGIAFRKKNR